MYLYLFTQLIKCNGNWLNVLQLINKIAWWVMKQQGLCITQAVYVKWITPHLNIVRKRVNFRFAKYRQSSRRLWILNYHLSRLCIFSTLNTSLIYVEQKRNESAFKWTNQSAPRTRSRYVFLGRKTKSY